MEREDSINQAVRQSLLYDFYGALLTQHQQIIYEDYVFNDLSLSEIADEKGISRQGVHDLIKRCNKLLENYEEKLGLVKKFLSIKDKINEMNKIAKEIRISKNIIAIDNIERISEEILEEF